MHQPLTMRPDSDTKRNLLEDYVLPLGTNEMLKIRDWKMRRNEGNQTPGSCQDGAPGMVLLGAHLEMWMLLLLTPATGSMTQVGDKHSAVPVSLKCSLQTPIPWWHHLTEHAFRVARYKLGKETPPPTRIISLKQDMFREYDIWLLGTFQSRSRTLSGDGRRGPQSSSEDCNENT